MTAEPPQYAPVREGPTVPITVWLLVFMLGLIVGVKLVYSFKIVLEEAEWSCPGVRIEGFDLPLKPICDEYRRKGHINTNAK